MLKYETAVYSYENFKINICVKRLHINEYWFIMSMLTILIREWIMWKHYLNAV